MTTAEMTLLLFTACNTLRVLAYVPQIVRIARDHEGAKAISYTTWGLFAVSHLSTVAYAFVHAQDLTLTIVFGGNTVACLAILGLTFWKRRQFAAGRVGGQALASSDAIQAIRVVSLGSKP
jgi:uncharacterized protein with PQ loop repeat